MKVRVSFFKYKTESEMMNLDQYLFTSGYRNPFKKKKDLICYFSIHTLNVKAAAIDPAC